MQIVKGDCPRMLALAVVEAWQAAHFPCLPPLHLDLMSDLGLGIRTVLRWRAGQGMEGRGGGSWVLGNRQRSSYSIRNGPAWTEGGEVGRTSSRRLRMYCSVLGHSSLPLGSDAMLA